MVFNANMIQSKKPESVNASGTTNSSSTKADVDSSSSSTIPTAYKTSYQRLNQISNRGEIENTSKDKMSSCQSLALEHFGSDGFTDDTKTQGDDKEHEEGQRVSSGIHDCHCGDSIFSLRLLLQHHKGADLPTIKNTVEAVFLPCAFR